MIAAEPAVRAWVNTWAASPASGGALAAGAFLDPPRSPAAGAYALLSRQQTAIAQPCAEDNAVCGARIQFDCYHATEELAELAAAGLATAIETLTGAPQPCGATGVSILCHDSLSGPVFVPPAPDAGEIFCFQIASDFLLARL